MKAALILSAFALVLWLAGNAMARKGADVALATQRPDGNGFEMAAVVAYLLAGAFGLVALLRLFS
jgi:hypothetical protein